MNNYSEHNSVNNQETDVEREEKGLALATLVRLFKKSAIQSSGIQNLRISGEGKKALKVVMEYMLERMSEWSVSQLTGDQVTITPEHIYNTLIIIIITMMILFMLDLVILYLHIIY